MTQIASDSEALHSIERLHPEQDTIATPTRAETYDFSRLQPVIISELVPKEDEQAGTQDSNQLSTCSSNLVLIDAEATISRASVADIIEIPHSAAYDESEPIQETPISIASQSQISIARSTEQMFIEYVSSSDINGSSSIRQEITDDWNIHSSQSVASIDSHEGVFQDAGKHNCQPTATLLPRLKFIPGKKIECTLFSTIHKGTRIPVWVDKVTPIQHVNPDPDPQETVDKPSPRKVKSNLKSANNEPLNLLLTKDGLFFQGCIT